MSEIVELSCGCEIFAPAGMYEVGHYTRCSAHSAVVEYDPSTGDPIFDRDVQVAAVKKP